MSGSKKISGTDKGIDESAIVQNGEVQAEPEEGTSTPPQDGNSGSGEGSGAGDGDKQKDMPKIGLFQFLQISPQKKGVAALMVSRHRAVVKTREQWEIAVEDILHKKTQ
jgi:hypothetical protein